ARRVRHGWNGRPWRRDQPLPARRGHDGGGVAHRTQRPRRDVAHAGTRRRPRVSCVRGRRCRLRCVPALRGTRAGRIRARRRARQQRRHHARRHLREDDQGHVGFGAAHQPRQHVQHVETVRARHDRRGLRADREHRVRQRFERCVRANELRGREGRHPRLHEGARARARASRRDGQHGRARLPGYGDARI
ncbi:hypothetical protein MTR_1529s0010, partial [Medicago truncatula]